MCEIWVLWQTWFFLLQTLDTKPRVSALVCGRERTPNSLNLDVLQNHCLDWRLSLLGISALCVREGGTKHIWEWTGLDIPTIICLCLLLRKKCLSNHFCPHVGSSRIVWAKKRGDLPVPHLKAQLCVCEFEMYAHAVAWAVWEDWFHRQRYHPLPDSLDRNDCSLILMAFFNSPVWDSLMCKKIKFNKKCYWVSCLWLFSRYDIQTGCFHTLNNLLLTHLSDHVQVVEKCIEKWIESALFSTE